MANGIHITVNTMALKEQLAAIRNTYTLSAKEVAIIESRSINDTLSHMRSFTSKGIRSTYFVKKKDIDVSMRVKKAHSRNNMSGSLLFQADKNIPLSMFGAKQGKNAVSVKILKSNRMRRIQAGGKQKILQTQKKKRAAVWIGRGQVLARSETSDMPIMLWGPSFMAYFTKPNVAETLQEESELWLSKRFNHHVTMMIAQKEKKNSRGKK